MKAAAALLSVGLVACAPKVPQPTEWFRDAAAETGLRFTHNPGLSGRYYLTEIMGSGAALFDFDNDGDLDAFIIQGHPDSGPSMLFRNELIPSGRLSFTDVTEHSGLSLRAVGMGAATGDFDNDGFLDLYVTTFGPNYLFHNNGNGTFTDVTKKAGVDDPRWSTSAAFFDYDRDGWQDLIVLNYTDFSFTNHKDCFTQNGEPDYCAPRVYNAVPDSLFHNNGNGTFTGVTVKSGLDRAFGPGLGVAVADFDNDGWLDVYIANDGAANLVWMNQRDGTFREEGLIRGAAYSEDGVAKAGMGISAGDFDNDGDEDVFIANLMNEGGTLYRNDGKGNFTDASLATALRPATLTLTGFGLQWFDFDHDGLLDLFIANGAVTKLASLRGQPYPFHQRNLLLRQSPRDRRIEDVSQSAGPQFAAEEVSRGAAFGDVDNDGDIDILVNNNNGPARLLLNQVAAGEWLVVRMRPSSNGALLRLLQSGQSLMQRRASTSGSYLSASDLRVHFAWPRSMKPETLVIREPSGAERTYPVKLRSFLDAR